MSETLLPIVQAQKAWQEAIKAGKEIEKILIQNGLRSESFYELKELIKQFWEIVCEFTEEEKSLLLKFVTSCERPSFLGFKDLQPPFTIRIIEK